MQKKFTAIHVYSFIKATGFCNVTLVEHNNVAILYISLRQKLVFLCFFATLHPIT